jgi:hypothetical protein
MGRTARVVAAVALITGSVIVVSTRPADAAKPPALPALPTVNPASPSLSAGGQAMLESASLEGAPQYALSAMVDPETGAVDGRMHARVARPDDGTAEFRVLAGLPALHAGLRVRDVTVNGKTVPPEVDRALLRVRVRPGSSNAVDVRLHFSYRVPRAGSTTGRPLSQETIGVLSRTRDLTMLGHWFPIWLPPGADDDPGLSGYGDIGNFAAGAITARMQIPSGYDVVSSGITVDRKHGNGATTVTESGVGLRDLGVVVGRGLRDTTTSAGDVTVRATARRPFALDGTAREAAADVQALADLFAPYPWAEVDVVVAPLGAGVGGMEWPGMVWIAQASGVDGDEESLALAHEIAHEWWHALVGNDSIRSPVVDEPLAQFSMCLVTRGGCSAVSFPGRLECADRPTPDFRSADQYGQLIYDQAPSFYFALTDAIGRDATLEPLRGVITRHAFGIVTPTELRDELVSALPGTDVGAFWDRYIGPPGCSE